MKTNGRNTVYHLGLAWNDGQNIVYRPWNRWISQVYDGNSKKRWRLWDCVPRKLPGKPITSKCTQLLTSNLNTMFTLQVSRRWGGSRWNGKWLLINLGDFICSKCSKWFRVKVSSVTGRKYGNLTQTMKRRHQLNAKYQNKTQQTGTRGKVNERTAIELRPHWNRSRWPLATPTLVSKSYLVMCPKIDYARQWFAER